jgi:hypothetical protein
MEFGFPSYTAASVALYPQLLPPDHHSQPLGNY